MQAIIVEYNVRILAVQQAMGSVLVWRPGSAQSSITEVLLVIYGSCGFFMARVPLINLNSNTTFKMLLILKFDI